MSAEAAEREIEVVHLTRKSHDVVLRLPEGTKTWDARVGFETAWREVTGKSLSFISRSARSVALAYLKGGDLYDSLGLSRKSHSCGFVFMETRGLERMLEEECDRILKALGETDAGDVVVKKPIAHGDVFVVKNGKETEQPSFARVARIVQECYRSVLGKQIQVAGRGMNALKSLHAVIEEHAPKMLSDASLHREARRELKDGGLA